MPTYLQIVSIPERCFLQEILRWLTFQRLPTSSYDAEGVEIHESREIYEYAADHPDIGDEYFTEDECKRAGIPPDPHLRGFLEGESSLPPDSYDKILATFDSADPRRDQLEREKQDAIFFQAECKAWKSKYEEAVEYPASRIFVALRSGNLTAQGRLLPATDLEKAMEILDEQDNEIFGIELSDIPPTFWSLKGIDFEKSSAFNEVAHYCHITCVTREVLALFPGEREAVGSVDRVGDSFVLNDLVEKPTTNSLRGRPAYPWDGFHVEVAAMVNDGTLPQKKEAAIHHFQEWFVQEHGVRPSRAAVGDKLKGYYEKFQKLRGQKSRP